MLISVALFDHQENFKISVNQSWIYLHSDLSPLSTSDSLCLVPPLKTETSLKPDIGRLLVDTQLLFSLLDLIPDDQYQSKL